MSPNENVIISNSFEEIVFSNRNREYGAYVLRKKQKVYVIIAFCISFFFVTSSAITTFVLNQRKGNTNGQLELGPMVLAMDSTIAIDLPELAEMKVEQTVRFVPPTVVDTVINEDLSGINSMDDLIADIGDPEPPTIIVPVSKEKEQDVEFVDKPFIIVEVPATFKGGNLNDFNKWVAQNIKYPQIAVENGITGKVNVQFIINSKGEVEDVTILRGADPALDQEAVRVIKSSPKWSAPLQSGRPVKQLFSLPVIFKLSQ